MKEGKKSDDRSSRPARTPSPAARPCPVCGAEAAPAHRPFCSPRCRDVDLGRWLKGAYVIPGRAPGLGEEDDEV